MDSWFAIVYEQASLAYRIGDFRRALAGLSRASDLASRVNIADKFHLANEMRANVLVDLGQYQMAGALLMVC